MVEGVVVLSEVMVVMDTPKSIDGDGGYGDGGGSSGDGNGGYDAVKVRITVMVMVIVVIKAMIEVMMFVLFRIIVFHLIWGHGEIW